MKDFKAEAIRLAQLGGYRCISPTTEQKFFFELMAKVPRKQYEGVLTAYLETKRNIMVKQQEDEMKLILVSRKII